MYRVPEGPITRRQPKRQLPAAVQPIIGFARQSMALVGMFWWGIKREEANECGFSNKQWVLGAFQVNLWIIWNGLINE